MILIVAIFAAAAVVIAVIVNRQTSPAIDQNGPEHPGWSHSKPEFEESKIAGLSEYPGTFAFDIVGESHYQDTLSELCGGKTKDGHQLESPALLVPYCNEHDPHAVAVLMGECELVGHLSGDDACKIRIAMKRMNLGGCSLKAPAMIVGGWKRKESEGHFGVKLDLPV